MKRKKFIKLLQGVGLSRNQANGMAEIVRERGGAYYHGWLYFQYLLEEIPRRVKAAVENRVLFGDPLAPYMGMQTEIQEPYFKPVEYRIDTKLIDPQPVIMWPKINPHLDGYNARIAIVDELATAPGGGEE